MIFIKIKKINLLFIYEVIYKCIIVIELNNVINYDRKIVNFFFF